MIISAANNLENNKKIVDELNVFPVPDGDTGTNMSLTLLTASREVKQKEDDSISVIADVLASASLRGARGNSGVILSQLFRGFAKGMKGSNAVDAKGLALALKAGVDIAYKAVMKPTEGTILTVAREGARIADEISKSNDNIIEVFEAVIEHAKNTLNKTPEMLPVLKKAGVVDAGGKGLIFILEGAFYALQADKEIELSKTPNAVTEHKSEIAAVENIQFMYCTEFLVRKRNGASNADKLKSKIEKLGDSMLVIDDEDVIKVHVHTNNPGTVIQESLKLGELTRIKIDNMKEQHKHLVSEEVKENKRYGFVTVAMGEGLKNIFRDLGADKIIEGGQTMNPSTDDILKAIDTIYAENIFVLPNNKNIILAAEQAKSLSEKNIIVIPTKSIPQGIASMLSFDAEAGQKENYEKMSAALEQVKTGQVTYAVRNSSIEDKDISEGDILGMHNGKIEIVGKDVNETCHELLDILVDEDSSMISIFYGQDIHNEEIEKLLKYAEERFSDCDIEIHDGGQPLYYYIISVE
ncbi:MAG: DAK2 domain-containing protein [Clostridia bacterium]